MGGSRVIEAGIGNQLKKGQGETNDRLEAILTAQNRTNELLLWLGQLLQATQNTPQP